MHGGTACLGLEPPQRRLGLLALGVLQQGLGSFELVQMFKGQCRGSESWHMGDSMARDREPRSKSHVTLIRHKEENEQSRAMEK